MKRPVVASPGATAGRLSWERGFLTVYRLEITSEALNDLKALRVFDRRRVSQAIDANLVHEPDRETQRRKHLKPNPLAEWEL